jgi:acetolactate decarboxylase
MRSADVIAWATLALSACEAPAKQLPSAQSTDVARSATVPVRVQTFGELHKIMHEGQTGEVFRVGDAIAQPHAFAVGALSGLRGEVTIRDGVIWLAYPQGDHARVAQDQQTSEQATLFVLSHVPAWQTSAITAPVSNADLDAFIEARAIAAGIDAGQPFPVRIEGPMVSVDWHVIDGNRLSEGGSHEDHLRAAVTGRLRDVEAELVGFFGQSAQGVFTHMGQRSHFHVIEPVSETTGHVDALEIGAGARLMLAVGAR